MSKPKRDWSRLELIVLLGLASSGMTEVVNLLFGPLGLPVWAMLVITLSLCFALGGFVGGPLLTRLDRGAEAIAFQKKHASERIGALASTMQLGMMAGRPHTDGTTRYSAWH